MKDKLWAVDLHCDSLSSFLEGERSLKEPKEGGHWDIIRTKQGRVALQIMAGFIESEYKPDRAAKRGLQYIEAFHRFEEENRKLVHWIKSKEDLKAFPYPGKIGLLLSIEGGEIIGEDLFMLDIIFKLGVRAMTLTWNQRNLIGYGAVDHPKGKGLTPFGQEVVLRMNQLGMVIDVSHLNENGFWQVLELSEQPIMASHSCADKLCSHPRNLSDEQLRALGEKGGMAGVNFCPVFLNNRSRATREDIVRHICHMVEIAGIDSVGLGSDFDGIDETPLNMEDVTKFPDLAEDLLKIGFKEDEIMKIFNKNFMRLLSNVLL